MSDPSNYQTIVHGVELYFHHVFTNVDGLTLGPDKLEGPIGRKLGGDIWPNEHVKPRALTLTVFCDRMRRAVQPF